MKTGHIPLPAATTAAATPSNKESKMNMRTMLMTVLTVAGVIAAPGFPAQAAENINLPARVKMCVVGIIT